MMNALGNELQWHWTMNKTNSVLSVSIYNESVRRSALEFEIPQGLTATRYENGDIYFDAEEIRMIEDELRLMLKDTTYAKKMAAKVYARVKAIEGYAFDPAQHKDKTLKELAALFKQEIEAFLWMTGYISYRGSVQMSAVLGEQVRAIVATRLAEQERLEEFDATMRLFQEPLKKTVVTAQKEALLRLAIAPSEEGYAQFIRDFDWLNYHWFRGSPLTQAELKKRAKGIQNPKKELQEFKEGSRKTEEKINAAIAKLSLSEDEQQLIKEYREWIFFPTFIKDNINLAAYKLLPLLELIGKKIGWPAQEIHWLTFDELCTIHKQDLALLEQKKEARKQSFGGTNTIQKRQIYAPAKPLREEVQQGKAIKGQTAFPGTVEGVARLIQEPKENARLQKGEILVTAMTTPDYLPAMERAAAFVTDEGGITCHAAIVARELKKPCVIGTRHATTLIKDGDRIRVDAENGTVAIV